MTRGIHRLATRILAGALAPEATAATRSVVALAGSAQDVLRRAVTVQGLATHLHRELAAADGVPASFRDWLADQDDRIGRRLERLHEDLERILAAAARTGIAMMPLKGALLTTGAMGEPLRRPMADLDLLVRPPDRSAARALLEQLGYRAEAERGRRPTHDVYVDPGGGRVVARDGEHPDNPRRVELHVEVRRHLWGWSDDDDLTDRLWASARDGTVLGQAARLPSPAALLAHLAVHASSDLLVGRGRLLQWLDLADVGGRTPDVGLLPHPRVAWVAMALARRTMPTSMGPVDLSRLRRTVPDRLVGWTASVPLDDRCGLSLGRPPEAAATLAARWDRWAPIPWKLAVAYGDLPAPLWLPRHAAMLARAGVRAAAQRVASRS